MIIYTSAIKVQGALHDQEMKISTVDTMCQKRGRNEAVPQAKITYGYTEPV